MRVLSPRMLPPVTSLEGSTASTATLCPASTSFMPRASTKVLLPAPGVPVTPRRIDLPDLGRRASRTRREVSRWRGLVLSIREKASVVVLGGDDAADDDQDVLAADQFGQFGGHVASGHERLVPGGERADADDVDVVLHACRATSSGVWNSGPMSTSKPMSAKAVAMTLAPRSWPSWPILATRMRGRRPSRLELVGHATDT
jgi:hypothetical protein